MGTQTPTTPAETESPSGWYGYQTIAMDVGFVLAGNLVLRLGDNLLEHDQGDMRRLALGYVAAWAATDAAIHLNQDNPRGAAGGVGVRLGLPYLAHVIAKDNFKLFLGAVITGMVVDSAVFARRPERGAPMMINAGTSF